jgi:Flp pilus assembly protein TadB
MKTKNFAEMSTEKLLEQTKSIKALTGLLGGMLLVLFFTGGYIFSTKGFNVFLIIPLALLPIVILNVKTLKEIKKELDSREK